MDEIELKTAPADFRFPTTNQTRHCFTRYIEFHRCTAAKGEESDACEKFARFYRALCPGEWVDRWNEQRENGTFPASVITIFLMMINLSEHENFKLLSIFYNYSLFFLDPDGLIKISIEILNFILIAATPCVTNFIVSSGLVYILIALLLY